MRNMQIKVAFCVFLLGVSAWAQERASGQRLADQISALSQSLASRPAGDVLARALLSERAALVRELIAADPARALAVSLPGNLTIELQAAAPEEALESLGQWTGKAWAIIEDDFVNRRSRTLWELAAENGTFEMYLAGRSPRTSGSKVTIQGLRSGERIAVAEILDESAADGPQCTTTGEQKIAVLMVTTPANPTFPPGYGFSDVQQKLFGPATGDLQTESVNSLWQQMSDSQTSATGEVFGPFELHQDFSCDDVFGLRAAAIDAADSTIDFAQFNQIVLLTPVGTCSVGGRASLGCQELSTPSKGTLTASFVWLFALPNDRTVPLGILTHELGHSLGLLHANSDDYGSVPLGSLDDPGSLEEYRDLFSDMGYVGVRSNSRPTFGQFSAQHKRLQLNWLPPHSVQEVQSSVTLTLPPFELPSGVRALRILRDAASGAWLWAEYRQPVGSIDESLALLKSYGTTNIFDGALLHYENPTLDLNSTNLLKFNPSKNKGIPFLNPTLTPGQTWSDPYSPLTLAVNSANSTGLSMTINYDQPCAKLLPSSTVFPSAGGSGSIAVAAPSTCAWTASTVADWIELTGATSGQGDGTVSFAVPPISTPRQRNARITVQRQSVPIVQTGTGSSVISMTSIARRGTSGQLTFQFSHESGYASLWVLFVEVSDIAGAFNGANSPECNIQVSSDGRISIRDRSGSNELELGPIRLGTPGQSVSNGQCTVYSTGSSITGAGNQLTLTLRVSFSASFAGTHRITAGAIGSGGSIQRVPLGIWTVAESPSRSLPPRGARSAIPIP